MICGSPDQLPARFYRWQLERAQGCPCCAFMRALVIGAALGAILGAGVVLLTS